jgi:hypothetical protein
VEHGWCRRRRSRGLPGTPSRARLKDLRIEDFQELPGPRRKLHPIQGFLRQLRTLGCAEIDKTETLRLACLLVSLEVAVLHATKALEELRDLILRRTLGHDNVQPLPRQLGDGRTPVFFDRNRPSGGAVEAALAVEVR